MESEVDKDSGVLQGYTQDTYCLKPPLLAVPHRRSMDDVDAVSPQRGITGKVMWEGRSESW